MSRSARGFSLIELMIVVVIVAVLASIAFPSYRAYVLRGNRTAAKVAMSQLASRMEDFFIDRKRYPANLQGLGYAAATMYLSGDGSLAASAQSGSVYALSLAGGLAAQCPAGGSPAASGYSVQAVPVGAQADDSGCATLCLGSNGTKLSSGGGADCWTR